jgi:hypothetical protein
MYKELLKYNCKDVTNIILEYYLPDKTEYIEKHRILMSNLLFPIQWCIICKRCKSYNCEHNNNQYNCQYCNMNLCPKKRSKLKYKNTINN